VLAAGKAARELDRARLDQRVRFAPRFGDGSEPAGALERLLGTAELCQQEGAVAFKYGRRLGEAALLAEGDPLLEGGKRAGRPLERVAGEREVVLQDRRVPARPRSMSRASARSISANPSASPRQTRAYPR